jgi:hypothetical protein
LIPLKNPVVSGTAWVDCILYYSRIWLVASQEPRMSLREFSRRGSLYGVDNLPGDQFPDDDRFRLFAAHERPLLAGARPALQAAYCRDNGRPGIEPVLLPGVSPPIADGPGQSDASPCSRLG